MYFKHAAFIFVCYLQFYALISFFNSPYVSLTLLLYFFIIFIIVFLVLLLFSLLLVLFCQSCSQSLIHSVIHSLTLNVCMFQWLLFGGKKFFFYLNFSFIFSSSISLWLGWRLVGLFLFLLFVFIKYCNVVLYSSKNIEADSLI